VVQVVGPPAPEELRADRRARRDRIIRAALKALANSDHESIKISDVARDADVALGTLYRYFSSKEHLFGAAFYEWQRAMKVRLDTSAPAGDTEYERVRDVAHRMIKAFQLQPQFFRVMMMLETTTDAHAKAVFESLGTQFDETFGPALDGPLEGDRAAIVKIVSSLLSTSMRSWVCGRGTIKAAYKDMDDVLRLIYRP
jgi:AcrR family transcriptional regulator